ncbi:cytochrome P450 [Streptomyces triticiradicis]|uniref:Cytochrome P450 n=1 Tax=Streptomyces triticiradicis TaxID=2651189 RepID=A0A7J5DN42_9ACTN|nr:cytochrome P450 [Streptomyces triticiradicis]KAB1990094.1 cytochrome P450 [Streptomyces triticiradicis]
MDRADDDARKIRRDRTGAGCPVGRGDDGTWQVRGYPAARAVLRSADTVQAGLGVETVEKLPARIRRPVLYRDGPEHREHRRQTARYFTPRRVDEHYRELAERVTHKHLDTLRAQGEAQLEDLTFGVAIDVACGVIGLTHGRPGIQHRLERFFPEKFGKPGLTSPHGLYWLFRQNTNWLRIYFADVRPAVRAHRERPADNLISHLIAEGCSDSEILGECLTYAAAGMVTTREFICVAAWHLFTDAALRERYSAGNETERLAVIHEILRLEPVVARLSRRTTGTVEVPGADGPVTVPAGALVDIFVDEANTDPDTVGATPTALCPGRAATTGRYAAALSFGDGPHRCPGADIAMMETNVFLGHLFALEGIRMLTPPRVTFQDEIGGYVIRGLRVAVDRR